MLAVREASMKNSVIAGCALVFVLTLCLVQRVHASLKLFPTEVFTA